MFSGGDYVRPPVYSSVHAAEEALEQERSQYARRRKGCCACALVAAAVCVVFLLSPKSIPDVTDPELRPRCKRFAKDKDRVVTLLSMDAGLPSAFVACMRANRLAYAQRHAMEYCEFGDRLSYQDGFSRQKLIALRSLLTDTSVRRSAVWYLDADAILVNFSISIEQAVLDKYSQDVIYTHDLGEVGVQAGSFVVRNTAWSLDFLDEIYKMWVHMSPFDWFSDRYAVMEWLRRAPEPSLERVIVLPSRTIDSMEFHEEDLVFHQATGIHNTGKYLPDSFLSQTCRAREKLGFDLQGAVNAPASERNRASATGNTSDLSAQNQQQSIHLGGEQQAEDARGRHNNRTEHAREGHGHGGRAEDSTTLLNTEGEDGKSSMEMHAQPADDAKPGGHRNNRTAHAEKIVADSVRAHGAHASREGRTHNAAAADADADASDTGGEATPATGAAAAVAGGPAGAAAANAAANAAAAAPGGHANGGVAAMAGVEANPAEDASAGHHRNHTAAHASREGRGHGASAQDALAPESSARQIPIAGDAREQQSHSQHAAVPRSLHAENPDLMNSSLQHEGLGAAHKSALEAAHTGRERV